MAAQLKFAKTSGIISFAQTSTKWTLGTMNSSVYLSFLESNVRPSDWQIKLGWNWVNQQNNDPKHSRTSTTEGLKMKRINDPVGWVQNSTWSKCCGWILTKMCVHKFLQTSMNQCSVVKKWTKIPPQWRERVKQSLRCLATPCSFEQYEHSLNHLRQGQKKKHKPLWMSIKLQSIFFCDVVYMESQNSDWIILMRYRDVRPPNQWDWRGW